ncbi:hypothetical protein ACFE04_026084 [Oxalis oulophora]
MEIDMVEGEETMGQVKVAMQGGHVQSTPPGFRATNGNLPHKVDENGVKVGNTRTTLQGLDFKLDHYFTVGPRNDVAPGNDPNNLTERRKRGRPRKYVNPNFTHGDHQSTPQGLRATNGNLHLKVDENGVMMGQTNSSSGLMEKRKCGRPRKYANPNFTHGDHQSTPQGLRATNANLHLKVDENGVMMGQTNSSSGLMEKRKRGRPRKYANPNFTHGDHQSTPQGLRATNANLPVDENGVMMGQTNSSSGLMEKQKCGRPRKYANPNFTHGDHQSTPQGLRATNANLPVDENGVMMGQTNSSSGLMEKRKRGRPRKYANPIYYSVRTTGKLTSDQIFHLTTAKNNDASKKIMLLNPKILEHYFLNYPSSSVAWRGCFQICDSVSSRLGEPYRYFKAQPPCRIQKKAYELLDNMPLMLQVKLIPHDRLWPNLFSPLLPDLHDIAVYFFPFDRYKSEENMVSLFELMDGQKSAMLTCIDGVDLIIFTSKQLHIDAQCDRKKILSVEKKPVEIPYPFVSTPDCLCLTNMEDNRVIDVEIDMVGGEETVGQVEAARVDSIPIQWPRTATGCVKLNVASWFNDDRGFSIAAGVVLDDSAMWLFGYSFKVNHQDKLTAVMDAFRYGLQILWDSGRRKVLVQSSLREAVELLEREQVPVADNPSLALISQKCRELIQAYWVCQLSLVNEQANLCANWLATHQHEDKDTLIFFAPPQEMRHLYQSDHAQERAASRVP